MKTWLLRKQQNDRSNQPTIKDSLIHTVFSKFMLMPIGFGANIFATRYLGLAGRGQFTLITTTIQTVTILGGLISASNDILQGEKSTRKKQLILQTLAAGLLIALFFLIFSLLAGRETLKVIIGSSNLSIISLVTLLIFFEILLEGFKSLLIAEQQIFSLNNIELTNSIIYLILIALSWSVNLGNQSALALLILLTIYVLSRLLKTLFYIVCLIPKIQYLKLKQKSLDFDLILLKQSLHVGSKAFLNSIPTLLILKADIYMLQAYANTVTVGVYQVAIGVSYLLFSLLFGGIYQVIRSKSVSNTEVETVNQICFISKLIILLSLIVYPLFLLFGKNLLFILYGRSFVNSYQALIVVFWASAFWCYINCLAGYIDAKGKYATRVTIYKYLGFTINIILNILLIPNLLEVGAALASCISYFVVALAYVSEFNRYTLVGIKKLMLFSKDEFQWCHNMFSS